MPRLRNKALWIGGLRLRTIPASLAPVILGGCSAWAVLTQTGGWPMRCLSGVSGACSAPWYSVPGALDRFVGVFALCLGVAMFLQTAVNFANDYSDGVRGSDSARGDDERRSGKPQRLTASGLVKPRSVLLAAAAAALAACLCGLAIVVITRQYWLVVVGVLCLLSGWFYTGGRHPYGYVGLGELFVFLFFGLVATLGTEFAICQSLDGLGVGGVSTFDFAGPGQDGSWDIFAALRGQYGIDRTGVIAAVCAGLYSVIILMVNNLRDVEDDTRSGKRTLAVRLGARSARLLLVVSIVVALALAAMLFLAVWWPWGLVVWLPLIPASFATVHAIRAGDYPRSLGGAGRQLLVFTALIVVATVLASV